MMRSGATHFDRPFFRRWVLHNILGWLLGFVILLLLVLLWDALNVGEAQFVVGVGMGAGIGFAQRRALRDRFDAGWPWVWTAAFGMGLPFIVSDIFHAFDLKIPFMLQANVVIGGLIVGLVQSKILSAHTPFARWWIPACVVGWGLGATTTVLWESALISGNVGGMWRLATFVLVVVVGGGAVLGAVTGVVLARVPVGIGAEAAYKPVPIATETPPPPDPHSTG